MEQLILKAVTTATEQGTEKGTFVAVISTATVDREKDIVSPAGMVRAIQKWAATGKKIPLAWNHSGDPDLQIGYIDPHSAKQVGNEVQVSGWIDQSIDAGAHAWRLVKAGTLGFSFGYLILKGTSRKGGGRNIDELDVFEATATPTPMNNDTRVLSYKAAATGTPLRILNSMIGQAQEYIDSAPDDEDGKEMQSILDDLKELISDVDDAADTAEDAAGDDGKALRRRADEVALEHVSDGASNHAANNAGKTTAPAKIDLEQQLQEVKAELAEVRGSLEDLMKKADATAKEPTRTRAADPLRARADAIALEVASDGESLKKPPAQKDAPKPRPELDLGELRQRTRDETLIALSGVDDL